MGINAKKKKIKVGLIIDEYFGACGTAFGGYGFLSRAYISRYIPDENIEVEVILSNYKRKRWSFNAIEEKVDGVKVIIPPGKKFVKQWINKQDYDIYLTVELTHNIIRKEGSLNPLGLTLLIENHTENQYYSGADYLLEKNREGTWYSRVGEFNAWAF